MPRRIKPRFKGRFRLDCSRGIFTVNGQTADLESTLWSGSTPDTINFTQGTSSNFSLASFRPANLPVLSVDSTSAYTAAQLAALGIVINDTTDTVEYDGTGAAQTLSNVVISASDSSTTAAEDWAYRTQTGPFASGVVWYHNFDNAGELSQFAHDWSGGSTSPSSIYITGSYAPKIRTDDGPSTQRCMEFICPGFPWLHVSAASSLQVGADWWTVFTTSVAHNLTTGHRVWFDQMNLCGSGWFNFNRSGLTNQGGSFGERPLTCVVINSTQFRVQADSRSYASYTPYTSPHDAGYKAGICQRFHISNGQWVRPFAPLLGTGNGRGVNDPAANGTLTCRSWSGGQASLPTFLNGFYAHTDYHTTHNSSMGNLTASNFDGTDFYIQFRYKTNNARFWQVGQPWGKLLFIRNCPGDSDGELVVQSTSYYKDPNNWDFSDANNMPNGRQAAFVTDANQIITTPLRMYASKTYFHDLVTDNAFGTRMPGADGTYPTTCVSANASSQGVNNCWWLPVDTWVTFLLRLRPGHTNVNTGFETSAPQKDTLLEVWAATPDRISSGAGYVKIYSGLWGWEWRDNDPRGWNAIAFDAYMNERPGTTDFYQRFAEVIFSKQFIPCPTYTP